MAAPLFPGNRSRTGRRGVSVIECALAVSVILGLMFVTVRVMNIGSPAPLVQAATTDKAPLETAETDTTVAKAQTPLLASETSDTKTP